MTAKKALTVLGLVFAATVGSYFFLLSGNERVARVWAEDTASVVSDRPAQPGEDRVIAYYFHVTVRCATCSKIEQYSAETIKEYFGPDLETGRIEWRPVNVQLPENRHFIKDYGLFTRSLVLVLMRNGKQKKYTVLDRTWELVGKKEWFKKYVRKETANYLGQVK